MLQFIKTQHCNNDTMKGEKNKIEKAGVQTFRLLKLWAYPFGIKAFLLCTHISPIPYRSHGPDTLRSGQRREHWVLYKSILCPQHFAAPGTPGKIIKRLARSSLPHHFFLRWELRAELKNVLFSFFFVVVVEVVSHKDKQCVVLQGNLGSPPFSLQSFLDWGHVTSVDVMKLVPLDLFVVSKCHPLPTVQLLQL